MGVTRRQRREKRIQCRVDELEYEVIAGKAMECGMELSAYVRGALIGSDESLHLRKDVQKLMTDVRKFRSLFVEVMDKSLSSERLGQRQFRAMVDRFS